MEVHTLAFPLPRSGDHEVARTPRQPTIPTSGTGHLWRPEGRRYIVVVFTVSIIIALHQSLDDAMRAPSTSEASLAQVITGTTVGALANVAKPQSLLAITFSRPTTEA